ncbi:hypothetical protein D3C80_2055440 [compost metagenome]
MPEQSQSDREISYRIGWKKGKIHVPEDAAREAGQTRQTHTDPKQTQELTHKADPLLGLLWKQAPYPGWRVIFWAAAVLPAAAFAVIVWLVSRMTEY